MCVLRVQTRRAVGILCARRDAARGRADGRRTARCPWPEGGTWWPEDKAPQTGVLRARRRCAKRVEVGVKRTKMGLAGAAALDARRRGGLSRQLPRRQRARGAPGAGTMQGMTCGRAALRRAELVGVWVTNAMINVGLAGGRANEKKRKRTCFQTFSEKRQEKNNRKRTRARGGTNGAVIMTPSVEASCCSFDNTEKKGQGLGGQKKQQRLV